ncbi:hypothetical protein ACTA71_003125 [Dictyostelium dimigraforme]
MEISNDKKVFFITGASKGFGLSITNQLLKLGFNVASTSRNKEELIQNVDDQFRNNKKFLPLQVDLTSEESVQKSIDETISKFGRIDVLINNAGYGIQGALEEFSDSEILTNYNINVLGVMHTIRSALPHLRNNKFFPEGPRIINISSIAGFCNYFPGFSIYSSTKFAIDGLSLGLMIDLKEFGIHVSTVNPGYFRTYFLEKGVLARPSKAIGEYTLVNKSKEIHDSQMNFKQPGDPEKGAAAIINLALMETPPPMLLLGSDAIKYAKMRMEQLEESIKSCMDISLSTDYEEVRNPAFK